MKNWVWKVKSPEVEGVSAQSRLQNSQQLAAETGLTPWVIQVLMKRGVSTREQVDRWLSPRLDQLTHPFQILDLEKAVNRFVRAKENSEKIRIFGDYDVDGTCGAALLTWVFREFELTCDATQPDRFLDGYGLNSGAVLAAHEAGIKLIVTVDCGITSHAQIDLATSLGIDVIVVDHHQVDAQKGVPNAWAVVNPQRADCSSGLKQLCGCGLAFYLAMGLRIRARELKWTPHGKSELPNLKNHLDLVVLATAADLVPLTGDNRVLVRQGLGVLKVTQKVGLRALLDVAGVNLNHISPSHLGFTLGPRINASGRIKNAGIALELLTTQDEVRAQSLAKEIERLNSERMEIQNKIWDDVKEKVTRSIEQGQFKNGIVIADAAWHEGVVGIVASRVTEHFHKPAIIIAIRDGHAKGSARSFGGRDVLAAIRAGARYLKGFGGHHHAAGVSLDPEQIPAFAHAFDEAVGLIPYDREESVLWVEGEIEPSDLTSKALAEFEQLAPFGPGNPEPVFVMKAGVHGDRLLKGRHVKLQFDSGLEGIWFHAAEKWAALQESTADDSSEPVMTWAGTPELNRFMGRVTPTFRVRDAQK